MSLEPRPLPRGDGEQDRLGTDGQHQGVAEEVEDPAEDLGRLDALARRLLQQPKRRGGIVVGEGLEHRQQPLVARRPEQARGRPRRSSRGLPEASSRSSSDCASRSEPPARRATICRASGSASTCSCWQISPRVCAITSGVMPAKSYRWHRERTVIGILFASVVAKKNLTWGGGSSRVFNSALKAPVESMCTSSM